MTMWIFRLRGMMFVIIASLTAFWPFLAGFHHNITTIENSLLRASLREQPLNREGSLVALCFLVPFLLDGLSDVLERWYWNEKKKDTTMEMFNDVEKIFLFVGFASAPCLAFISPDYDSLALLWICLTRFQTVAVLGTLHVSFSRSNCQALPWWMSSVLSVSILTVALNISTWASITGDSGTGEIISIAMTAIVLAMIMVPSGLWLLRKSISRYNFNHKVIPNDDGTIDNLNNTENKWNYPDFYLVFGSSCFVVLVSSLILGSANQFTPQMLLTYKSAFIVVEVLFLFLYMRKNKYDSISNLSASMESRKQYLRYIAHEMRTPLNSAVLGLKLICDSLATIENKGIKP